VGAGGAGRGISPWGDEHVDDLPDLVDRAVEVAPLPGDPHLRLVHRPSISHGVSTWAGGLGQQRREPKHPSIHGDVVDLDAPLGQQFLEVAARQPKSQLPADRQDDHLGREAKAGEGRLRDGTKARAASSHADSLAAARRADSTGRRNTPSSGGVDGTTTGLGCCGDRKAADAVAWPAAGGAA
jgi:hypothetical protein